jgi:hypothetical protein
MATWSDVRRLALALPGASEKVSSSGHRAWLVQEKGFTWERPLRRADLAALGDTAPTGPILGVRTADLEMKEVLLASDPEVFFTTPHFNGYPAVLVRLPKIASKLLKDVIVEAWLAVAPKRAATAFCCNKRKRRRAQLDAARESKTSIVYKERCPTTRPTALVVSAP